MHGENSAPLTLVAATERDIDGVFGLYQACTATMLRRGIRQWDERYPTRETALAATVRGDLFLLVKGAVSVGAVTLNGLAAPEYAPITWRCPEPALVIHALVIDPERQGAGLGRAAIGCCEAFARARGFGCVRLDAYPGNPAAIALYEGLGYELRGHVRFDFKPPGHERYAVYEKALSPA